MLFKKPIGNGHVVRFESRVVFAGKTRLVSYVKVLENSDEDFLLDGFISFIHVDLKGKPVPHGIVIEATDPEDRALQELAKKL
jgi:acyl-CoA hydrolase